jgi:hypothetical protein
MHYLEKLEEKDSVSMIDAKRWVEYHREKLAREREEHDQMITSREYWRDLDASRWTLKLMMESLEKMGYDNSGKKESLVGNC